MSAFFRWVVERRLLTLAGFAVILLGAFIPWGSLAIAALVIVFGAVLMAVQIPIAMRDGTADVKQLEELELPEEQRQAQTQPPFQPEPYQQPKPYQQRTPSQQSAPSQQEDEPSLPWRPKNIPQFHQPGQ